MMMKTATQAVPTPGHEDDTLSAFLDGELSDEQARQVLRHLDASLEVRDRAWSYMAVGDALRGLHAAPPSSHLTERVMVALAREPTVLAPMRRPRDRRATLWLAAAAIGAITWGLWQSLPDGGPAVPLAVNDPHPPMDVQPYLAAHQDFAQAVIAPAEMNFTQVSLAEVRP